MIKAIRNDGYVPRTRCGVKYRTADPGSSETPSLRRSRVCSAALRCATQCARETALLRGLLVGIDQIAGFLIGRRDHGLIAHAAPGLEVGGVGEAVILHLQHSGFGPLAVFAEFDVAHN